jgi:hypothetical protein
MNKIFIILLKNNYLLFPTKKPKKKGNFTNEVKLFELDGKSPCQDITKWVESNYDLPNIKEIKDWE